MKRLQTLFFTTLLLTAFSCAYDTEEEPQPQNPACQTEALSYVSHIKTIIDTKCATSGCHVAGNGRANLSTYQGVKQMADAGMIHQKVIVEKSMPPAAPLSSCELNQLEAWLQAGAPEE